MECPQSGGFPNNQLRGDALGAYGKLFFSINATSIFAEISPIGKVSMWTLVISGSIIEQIGLSINPAIARSSGSLLCRAVAALIAPTAIVSLVQNSAVGGSGSPSMVSTQCFASSTFASIVWIYR